MFLDLNFVVLRMATHTEIKECMDRLYLTTSNVSISSGNMEEL